MKQKISIFILIAVFLFSQVGIVEAKGFSGARSSSKSFGGFSGSSKKSFGGSSKSFSGSSKSTAGSSKSSSWGSSKSTTSTSKSSGGFTGSSSRSVPGSYSNSSASSSKSKAPGGTGTSTAGTGSNTTAKASGSSASTAKSTFMNDTYKKQSSGRSYTTYQQKLNTEQQKAYNTSYSKNYNYQRTGFEDSMRTRPQRISMFDRRPIIVAANPMYFGGPLSYGSAFVGMWDMWFLMRASDMFWFHHWNDIYPYRDYFEASKFADMEKRVKALEQQGVVRDESYVDPEVDPDLQFSDEYTQKNIDKVYHTDKYSTPSTNPVAAVIILVGVGVVLVIILRKVSKPKPKKTFQSRIY